MTDYGSSSASSGDAELQDFLMVEKQKAQVNAQVSVNTQNRFYCDFICFICDLVDSREQITLIEYAFLFAIIFRSMNLQRFVGSDVWTHQALNLIVKPKHAYQIVWIDLLIRRY